MENPVIKAQRRQPGGKGPARQLRLKSRVPGIFYRRGEENIPFSVDEKELSTILRGRHSLIDFNIEGVSSRECIIRELQRDPVSERVLHLDLMGIQRGVKLTVTVPIRLIGTPTGVKTGGGILEHGLDEVEIECLPKDIPSEISIDVSDLHIGQSIHIRDLDYPQFRFLDDPGIVLATVVSPVVPREPSVGAEPESAAEPGESAEE